MRNRMILGMLAALILIGACDDRTSVPQNVQDAATKAQADAAKGPQRPTTQELLTGPKKRLALTPLPFSAQVPGSWRVETLASGSLTVLTGPTPSGEAQVQLSSRSLTSKDELGVIQRAAKKELATTQAGTKHVLKADFRKLGDAELFERQAVGQPGPLVVTDLNNQEHTVTATPYTWTITLFVPKGDSYAKFELNFLGLTAEQYKQDKALLDQIVNSLAHDPTAAPATQPI
ncbi:MAG TPA: hypothetical protein VF669_01620 [Tepidisphaeraceae bacterium]